MISGYWSRLDEISQHLGSLRFTFFLEVSRISSLAARNHKRSVPASKRLPEHPEEKHSAFQRLFHAIVQPASAASRSESRMPAHPPPVPLGAQARGSAAGRPSDRLQLPAGTAAASLAGRGR